MMHDLNFRFQNNSHVVVVVNIVVVVVFFNVFMSPLSVFPGWIEGEES